MSKKIAIGFLFVYVLALHCSIALMEIASWTLFAIALYRAAREKGSFWFPHWPAFAGLAIAVMIGLFLNPADRTFVEQMGFMRWIILMYSTAWILHDVWDEKLEAALAKFWVVVAVVTGIYAFMQCMTGLDLIRPGTDTVTNQGGVWRATGWFSASLTFGYCLGFMFFTVLMPAGRLKPSTWKWAALICGPLGVFASLSRGAWVGMVAAGLFYFVCEKRRMVPWFLGGLAVR